MSTITIAGFPNEGGAVHVHVKVPDADAERLRDQLGKLVDTKIQAVYFTEEPDVPCPTPASTQGQRKTATAQRKAAPAKPELLACGDRHVGCEVTKTGKYWGYKHGSWYRIKVLSLPDGKGGTGGIAYAPIDPRGYPYSGGVALCDCEFVWGPVTAWGNAAPKVSKAALLRKSASPFWLRKR